MLHLSWTQFGRIRVHKFVAGKPKTHAPTGSRAPSKNPSLEPSIAPSLSSKPSVTKYAIEVQIKLDNDSSQTGWSITSVDDGTVIIDRPPGYFSGNDTQILVETIRLEAGEYTFSVLDSNGDGFCCEQGIGYYSLYSNKKLLLFRQGEFEYSYSETFLIGTAPPPTNNEGTISKLAPMLRGSIQSSYYIKRQRKHVDQEPWESIFLRFHVAGREKRLYYILPGWQSGNSDCIGDHKIHPCCQVNGSTYHFHFYVQCILKLKSLTFIEFQVSG